MTPAGWAAIARKYCEDVQAGTIPACSWVLMATKRQLDDLERPLSADWPWVYDEAKAGRVCAFISRLPHVKGRWARERRRLVLEPWQVWILTTVFGWVHHQTRLRRFTEVYEEEPRKNAKSTKGAGVVLYLAFADDEEGAEVYTGATTLDQARIVYEDARRMAVKEPMMCHALGIDPGLRSIAQPGTNSKLAPLAAEGSTLDGLNVHGALLDEVHAHKRRDLYDVIDSARGSREQSLLWLITTAGSDRSGIGYERRTYLTHVLSGVYRDDRLFGVIYTIDKDDDPHSEATWRKANPNYGISVLPDDMETASRKAQGMASAMANFLTKRLNVWIASHSAWMHMPAWDACADPTLREEDCLHLPCYIGLDLASKVDVACKVKIYEDAALDRFYLFLSAYLPERQVEISSNSQYEGWQRSGHILVTDGEVTDFDVIEDGLRDDAALCEDLREVGFDPWQATQLASHMLAEGVPMVEVRQTVQNLSEPMKWFEALVLKGQLRHTGNPAMAWMVSNVVARLDAKENVYPVKDRPEQKIDGTVAAIVALSRALSNRQEPEPDYGEVIKL